MREEIICGRRDGSEACVERRGVSRTLSMLDEAMHISIDIYLV
jgi:hypothetical protein